jgi:3-oxoacyl-[acyl-carrier protein] reductase
METTTNKNDNRSSDASRSLAGKVALVTGGARGIGAGIVRRLAADGAMVAFTYAGSKESADALVATIAGAGGKGLAIKADSAEPEAVRRAVAQTVETFGRLDILVNNAALLMAGPLVEMSAESLDKMLAVNVRGPVVAIQASLAHMGEGGRIVNIGSVNDTYVPFPGISLYALTKGAILGLTHGLTHELGARGITINNIQPGPVDTDMNPADGPNGKHLASLIALKRFGKTSEIAGLVSYLVSDEAAYVTGASFKIDGGFSA